MKLHSSQLSPFVRKAAILIAAKGLQNQIEIVPSVMDGPNGHTGAGNPLGKIPALERDGKETLFDSSVICEYLDSLSDPWLPASGEKRFEQMRLHALGDGLSVAVYNYRYETARDENLHWADMIERHNTAMHSVVGALEASVASLGQPWTYGNLAVVCALDYMGFRAGHIDWRKQAPKLAAWYSAFEADSHFIATRAYD